MFGRPADLDKLDSLLEETVPPKSSSLLLFASQQSGKLCSRPDKMLSALKRAVKLAFQGRLGHTGGSCFATISNLEGSIGVMKDMLAMTLVGHATRSHVLTSLGISRIIRTHLTSTAARQHSDAQMISMATWPRVVSRGQSS